MKKSDNFAPIDPESLAGTPVLTPFTKLLNEENIRIRPLVPDLQVESLEDGESNQETNLSVLSGYYLVDAPDDRLETLLAKFNGRAEIEAAYIKPPAQPASTLAAPETTLRRQIFLHVRDIWTPRLMESTHDMRGPYLVEQEAM
ncbi:hypothetical protein [Paenibacillus sp. JCM 10914]|uniref:hypothetical protein n=1 Tax=Paenibacillus sp. JCM 10914 TaxID=1236974 RepID=UPI001E50AC69|nr:hypothetical protein [Paenibacillus sp. JCM 10914]